MIYTILFALIKSFLPFEVNDFLVQKNTFVIWVKVLRTVGLQTIHL